MITSALANSAGFQSIDPAVRDFYSREVFRKAQPRTRFLQFAKVRRDLQAVRGKSIVFTKYENLTGGGSLTETDTLTPEALAASEITIAVTEQANAVQVTEFLIRTSLFDQMEEASTALANNLAIVLDGQLRDTILSTTNVVYGNGAASAAVSIKDAVELLATNNAPKINGEYYVCFAHPHQLRNLRDDPDWVAVHQYGNNTQRPLYLGECGMYEGVIFIDTTQMPKLSNAQVIAKYGGGFTPTNGYEAIIFGENTLAWAVALDPELRDDGVVELGRKHTLGWYGIWGTGLLDSDYAVRILTV